MNYAYDLYDALVAINVPGDRARTVVVALEERMTSELVTKADLRIAVGELRGETSALEKTLRSEIAAVEASLRAEIASLRAEMTALRAEMKHDILALENRLMHKMGGLMVALTGLLFVALKLT